MASSALQLRTASFRSHFRLVLVSTLVLLTCACARPPELIGVENASAAAAAQSNLTKHKIFVSTTRAPSDEEGALFSGDRSRDLGLAVVDVTIPPIHEVGRIERPRRLPPDPATEFTIIDPIIFENDGSFIASINRELAKRPPSERNILFFIHGYNNSTTDALLHLAQFVEDSGFEGVPLLMSWASAASTTSYVYDLNSAFIARRMLPEIGELLQRTDANTINIFAHSMGTLLTMEGIANASEVGRATNIKKIDNIMLASPDIDIDLFRTQMEVIPRVITEKIFILTSEDDSALRASRTIAGGVPRVGSADAEDLEKEFGITVIDLSDIDDSGSGSHSKFTGSPAVVQLIGLGLNSTGEFGASSAPATERILANSPIRIFD